MAGRVVPPAQAATQPEPGRLGAVMLSTAATAPVEGMPPRPATVTGVKYNEVSAAFWNAAHEVLSGKTKAEDSLKKLETKIESIRRGPKW